MAVSDFSEEYTFILNQTIESNLAILGDDDQVSIIISKLEAFDDVVDLNLVVDHERLGVVNVNVVAVFAHESKLLMQKVSVSNGSFCEGNMHIFWWKFKVHHLDW